MGTFVDKKCHKNQFFVSRVYARLQIFTLVINLCIICSEFTQKLKGVVFAYVRMRIRARKLTPTKTLPLIKGEQQSLILPVLKNEKEETT